MVDKTQVADAMTDIPTPALSEELDAVIELMQAKVSGAIFNGIKAFEHEPRRVLAVLLAARQQLAEQKRIAIDLFDKCQEYKQQLAEMRGAALRLVNALRHPSQGLLSQGGGLTMDARCGLIELEAALRGKDSKLIADIKAALAPTPSPALRDLAGKLRACASSDPLDERETSPRWLQEKMREVAALLESLAEGV